MKNILVIMSTVFMLCVGMTITPPQVAHAVAIPDCNARGSEVNLSGCDLTDAVLANIDLRRVDFTDAILTRADLTNAVLTNAKFINADLTDATLDRATTESQRILDRFRQRNDDDPSSPPMSGICRSASIRS